MTRLIVWKLCEKLYKDLDSLRGIAGMKARKWISNSPEVVAATPEEMTGLPTSNITIIITVIRAFMLFMSYSGNAKKHHHKDTYDRHNHNQEKMTNHFLMITIMFAIMIMLKWKRET